MSYCLCYPSNLIFAAPTFSKSRSLTTDDIRLMGWKDASSLGNSPAFSNRMIMATLQIRGQWAREKNELNMDNNFWRTKGSSDLRNEGGMLSGPTVPLTVFKLTVEISINSWHVKFTDPGILVYKNVGFGFDVGDGTSVVGRCFVWWEYCWNEIYEEICFFGKIVHLRLYLVDKIWSTSSKTKHENMTLTSKKSTLVCSRFE